MPYLLHTPVEAGLFASLKVCTLHCSFALSISACHRCYLLAAVRTILPQTRPLPHCNAQGENNVYEGPLVGHNLTNSTPYTCMLPQMVARWRRDWSAVPSTTPPDAPFGVVELAGGTSEGHQYNMPYFRRAQTAGYGVMPNAALPNTFFASAFDLPDPWGDGCASRFANESSCCRAQWFTPVDPRRCVVAACKAHANWSWDDTEDFMGPIHPRPKLPVARRLAKSAHALFYGGLGPVTGPVLAGCTVVGSTIQLRFNSSLLRGDSLLIQPYNTSAMASAMEVMINGTLPKAVAPGIWLGAQIRAGGGGGTGIAEAPVIVVDISHLNGTAPLGVRYAWGSSPCCLNFPLYPQGDQPCLPASCPLMGTPSTLPAMPFQAAIVGGRCECTPPQRCDG